MAFIHYLPDVIVLEIFQGCHFRVVVDGVLEHPYQFVIIPGLGDEIGGSAFQSLDGKLHIGKGGDEHHGDVGMEPAEGAEPEQAVLTAVYAEREVHVEQDEIYLLLLQQRGGGIGARQGENPFERIAQTDFQRREYRRIIVDDKKGSIFHIFFFCLQKYAFFPKRQIKTGLLCDNHTIECMNFIQSTFRAGENLGRKREKPYLCSS